MAASPATSARPNRLAGALGPAERLFARTVDRSFLRAVDDGLSRTEALLTEQLAFGDDLADVTSRYLLDAGGKRTRPMLMMLTAQLGAGATDEIVTAAQAIELTHLASLYHDDVMDDARLRRGVPAAQTVWGNSVAVLTGDLLFARASTLISALGERAIRLQAATFERLCLGQLHETTGPRPGEDVVDHYLSVLADKTGSLIATAAQMGVVFSGAPSAYEEPARVYGEKIGVAFQLVDDVIDLRSAHGETGKNPGTDLKAGVVTLPLLRLREHAATDDASARLLTRLEAEVVGADEDADVSALLGELRDSPATAEVIAEAHRWAHDAVAALEPLPAGPVRRALTRFADTIVERSS